MRLVSFLLLLMAIVSGAIAEELTFSKVYGRYTYSGAIAAIPDGGYVIAGSAWAGQTQDALVFRINSSGKVLWKKSFVGKVDDMFDSVLVTNDNSIVISGTTYSFSPRVAGVYPNGDILVIKMDLSGNVIWTKLYGGPGSDSRSAIRQTSDGGFVILAQTGSFESSDPAQYTNWDMLVLKIDMHGKLQWSSKIASREDDTPVSITQAKSGGFFITGVPRWLIKLTPDGKLQWRRQIEDMLYANAVVENSDGTLFVSGDFFSLDEEGILISKTTSTGKLLWTRLYQSTDWTGNNSWITRAPDGGLLATSSGNGEIIFEISSNGTVLWARRIDGIDFVPGPPVASNDTISFIGDTQFGLRGSQSIDVLRLTRQGELFGCTINGKVKLKVRKINASSSAGEELIVYQDLPFKGKAIKISLRTPTLPVGEFCN